MSNYPPGCSDSTYGAPWNDEEFEREVEVVLKSYITVSFKGPASIDEEEIVKAVKEQVREDLSKINYDIEDIIVKR